MAAVFWETWLGGSFFNNCTNGSAAIFLNRRGGRTDLYHLISLSALRVDADEAMQDLDPTSNQSLL
jgi:hypothetical protein